MSAVTLSTCLNQVSTKSGQAHTYPRNINGFNSYAIKPLLDAGSPKLTQNNPEFTDDGYYCVLAQDIFSATSDYFPNDDAWANMVKSLSGTRAYTSTANDSIVFMRARIFYKNGKPISPTAKANDIAFDIVRNEKYYLDLTYRFPIQLADKTKTTQVLVAVDDPPFRLEEDKQVSIDSISNNMRRAFTTRKYPEETTGKICLTYPASITGPTAELAPI